MANETTSGQAAIHSHTGLLRRAAARLIDLSLLSIVAAPTFLAIAPLLAGQTAQGFAAAAMTPPLGPIIFTSCVLMVSLLMEALILSMFGNTPGKKLLGLRVVDSQGRLLRFGRASRRAVHLWVEGYFLAASILTPIAHAWQAVRLKRRGETTYDNRLGTRVVSVCPMSAIRKVAAVLAVVSTYVASSGIIAGLLLRAAGLIEMAP